MTSGNRVRLTVAALAAILTLLTTVRSSAAEPLRFNTPAQCVTEGGATVELDPGVYLTLDDWGTLDAELIRLQDSETRLTAENDAFRQSAKSTAPLSIMVSIAVAAFALGWVI